jgi:rRNA pseudouridine-1189 N-methylase Emg1 (Nep1/Mra1 family)
MNPTTIQLDKELVNSLKDVREYPRQTYNELISRMIDVFKAMKRKNQYDEFLHKIQQVKMKELWDNEEDEGWENA